MKKETTWESVYSEAQLCQYVNKIECEMDLSLSFSNEQTKCKLNLKMTLQTWLFRMAGFSLAVIVDYKKLLGGI